jgi:hypothetical protein
MMLFKPIGSGWHGGDRIVRKDQESDLFDVRYGVPGQVDHRGRGVGGDHSVTGVDQVPGQ